MPYKKEEPRGNMRVLPLCQWTGERSLLSDKHPLDLVWEDLSKEEKDLWNNGILTILAI
jgi:hypothetical protein